MKLLGVCSGDLHHVPVDDPSCQPARLHHHWNMGCVSENKLSCVFFFFSQHLQTDRAAAQDSSCLNVSLVPQDACYLCSDQDDLQRLHTVPDVFPFLEGESVYSAVVVRIPLGCSGPPVPDSASSFTPSSHICSPAATSNGCFYGGNEEAEPLAAFSVRHSARRQVVAHKRHLSQSVWIQSDPRQRFRAERSENLSHVLKCVATAGRN